MDDEKVEVQYRYFRNSDGGMREEIWCGGKLVATYPLYDWVGGGLWDFLVEQAERQPFASELR